MDVLIQVLNGLAMTMPVLLAVGAGWKYLPVLRNYTNSVIPLLNAVVAFLVAFGGGVTPAHAGLLGDVGKALSLPAQMVASVLLSWVTSSIYDRFLKGVTPPTPVPAPKK
jgi:hypothetical protein